MKTNLFQTLAAATSTWSQPSSPSLDWDLTSLDRALGGNFDLDWSAVREAVERFAAEGEWVPATGIALWLLKHPNEEAQRWGCNLMSMLAEDAQDYASQFATMLQCQCRLYGVGTEQDFGRAMEDLFRVHFQASDDGMLPHSFTLLGDVWAKGLIGGVVDHDLADHYYSIAAEDYKTTSGPYGAGLFWDPLSNAGQPRAALPDSVIAAGYYSLAADHGNDGAALKIDMLFAARKLFRRGDSTLSATETS